MKIGFFARSLPEHGGGGMEALTWRLASGLAGRGHEVTIHTTAPGPLGNGDLLGLAVVHLGGTPGANSRAWFRRAARVDVNSFDVLVGVSAAGRTVVRRKNRPPMVMQAHGTSWDELLTKLATASVRSFVRMPKNLVWLIRDATDYPMYDSVVGVSVSVERSLRSYPSVARPRSYVTINNGVEASLSSSVSSAATPFFLFAGRLHREKGIEFAIRLAEVASVQLVVAGDGPEMRRSLAQAARLGISASVRFLGRVDRDEMATLMANASAILMPSRRREGLSLVALEALAAGTPVLASRGVTWSFQKPLPDGVSEIDLNLDAWVAAIGSLPSERMVDLPVEYTMKHMVDQYESLLSRLASRHTKDLP